MTPEPTGGAAPEVDEPRRWSPSAERNRDHVLAVLRDALPATGLVLEVASGSGMHAVHFAPALPDLTWQPTELAPENLASIDAWAAEAPAANLRTARALDVRDVPWPADLEPPDAVVNLNMIHAAPWAACEGLLAGAALLLRPGGVLFMYGPYLIDGLPTTPSNAQFDASLKRHDPEWGLRDLEVVRALAAAHGLVREAVVETPVNNLSITYRKRA